MSIFYRKKGKKNNFQECLAKKINIFDFLIQIQLYFEQKK